MTFWPKKRRVKIKRNKKNRKEVIADGKTYRESRRIIDNSCGLLLGKYGDFRKKIDRIRIQFNTDSVGSRYAGGTNFLYNIAF